MGKTLVLAEKPSVGKEIARVLGARAGRDGHIVGNDYIVTWALGHLVGLAPPEKYDEKYKSWRIETLPMLPEKMKLEILKETHKQFRVVKALMADESVDKLVIATDAGREGELVARWIIKKAGFKKPIFRLWISSQTDKAIRDGFNNLEPAKNYDNLFKSAECRSIADWLVGLNVTRALTCKYNAQLSAGRVQTPTLAMIVMRENEIKKFVPKDYFTVSTSLSGFSVMYRDKNGQTHINDSDFANTLSQKIKGAAAKITDVKKVQKKEPTPLLYDLTELQRDANRRYSYSAKKTLSIMQSLYERHKLLTYPRTDSKYISDDIVPTLTDRLKAVRTGPFIDAASAILKRGIHPTKRFVDNSKVTDHHAIIPTEQYVDLSALTSEEKNVYTLVVNRFFAALMTDFVYEQTTITADICGEEFFAKGKVVKDAGWKAVYSAPVDDEEESDEPEQVLPSVSVNDTYTVTGSIVKAQKTKPPARYTEATLLSAMEHPGKFLDDKALSKLVESTGGLGTPATRADIIEKLFNTAYIEKQGKSIYPTAKGCQLIDIVPPDLKSPELTGEWERELKEIAEGFIKPDAFTEKMRAYAKKLVSDVIKSDAVYRHENKSTKKCPSCEGDLLEINSKHGKMLVCADRECGYRENLSFISNARCPECHKKLEVFGEGEKKIYHCRCGFKRKFDQFNEELAKNRSNLNKREVANYLRQQDAEKPLNTAFSDALSGLKLE